ncbi:hypothetical protein J4421_03505 [Candidatus Woesearchaeota archaeon]|nr:hypothetical protein [Candidatus Woesearchaeota archaeon]
MTIVKINLNKVHASRDLNAKGGQIKINNNVSLKELEEMDFAVDGKKGLKFNFAFVCNYEPDLGKIEVEGQVLYVNEEKKIKEIKTNWDKEKRIPLDVMEEVINAALHKGNIQAIKISEDVNLPSPLPLPKVRQPQPETQAEKKK